MKSAFNTAWLFVSIMAFALFTSCDKEKVDYEGNSPEGSGQLSFAELSFSVDTAVITKANTNLNTYWVQVCETGTTTPVGTNKWKYSEIPPIITLQTGTYDLRIFSEETEPAAGFNNALYGAVKKFTIEANKVTKLDNIVCSLRNIKIQVHIPDMEALDKELLPGYTVQVDNGGTGILVFSKTDIEAMMANEKSAYFPAPKETNNFTVRLVGRRPDNDPVMESKVISGVKAGEFHKVTVNISFTGGLRSALTIDSSMDIVNSDVNIPVEDEVLPPDPETPTDPEDPTTPDDPASNPSVAGRGFNISEAVTLTGSRTLVVDIKAPKKIKDLNVKIDSNVLSQVPGLPLNFNLADPQYFAMFGNAGGFGLITVAPRGETDLVFDISQFTGLLTGLGEGTHKFNIEVVDENNQSAAATLTLITK